MIYKTISGEINKANGDISGDMLPIAIKIFDKSYIHFQRNAVEYWIINHRLKKFPSVTIIDSDGEQLIGDIRYRDENIVEIRFTKPYEGRAYLN